MMKLLVINDFGTSGGGTENRISTLMDYFLEKRVFDEVHVIQKGPLKQQNEYDSKKTFKKKIYYHSCPKGHFKSYFFTKRIIRKYNIDFVQAHNMMALTPAPLLAAKHLNKPVAWYAHDYWAMCALRNFIDPRNAMKKSICGKAYGRKCSQCRRSLRNSLRLMLWRWIINKADLAIATGKNMIDIYSSDGILKRKWAVVTPWIDPSMMGSVSIRKRNRNVLFVGSLMDYKGAWVAVKAMKYILRKVPEARLVIVGDEQDKNSVFRRRIEAIATEENVTDSLDFLGKRSREEIRKMLQNSGVYVCPTVCVESFGLNWAEAMAQGCPVVASSIGTIPEHINGRNGLLFKPRDEKELAEKIISIIKNRRLAECIGRNGASYSREAFNIESSGRKITGLYRRVYKNMAD